MYTYVSALAKPVAPGSRWKSVNIANVKLITIFTSYENAYVVLRNNFFPDLVGFDLATIRTEYYKSTLTLAQFLTSIGNNALPHMEKVPTLNTRLTKYADAFHAGYKIKPIHKTAAIDSVLPRSEKTYLHLTKPDIDYKDFYDHCLVSVNGYLHMTDYDTTGIYVVDGNKSAVHSNNNQMGIYSFKELGPIKPIPITAGMISRQLENIPLKNKVYLKLPEKIENKVPMLVLGGYLHIFDPHTFYLVDEQTICINFLNYRFLDRYYESLKYIDLSSLPIDHYQRNKTQLDLENFFSDEVIKAYLTLTQSFIVLLDADNVFAEKVGIDSSKMPGMLVTHLKPNLPLIGGYGRLMDYWYTYEDRRYSITCVDDYIDTHVYNTTDWYKIPSVADNRLSTERIQKSYSHFLRIGVDIET